LQPIQRFPRWKQGLKKSLFELGGLNKNLDGYKYSNRLSTKAFLRNYWVLPIYRTSKDQVSIK
jgi:hypothetical protein